MLKTIFIVLLILLILSTIIHCNQPVRESFTGKDKFTYKNSDLYDDFYADVYDNLVQNPNKNNFELAQIKNYVEKGDVLDVGSGTGHHVDAFNKNDYKCIGIDTSSAMIKQAQKNYPEGQFVHQSVLKPMAFQPDSFDLITILYFTIYYIKDKEQLFRNCMLWLRKGGYLVIHLVDKHKFNPMVPAGEPFTLISPQNYADERINDSVVDFNNFKYKSNFSLPKKNEGLFKEYFKFKNSNKVRQNDHIFYMEGQREIVNLAKNTGFKLVDTIPMTKCNYDHQYLYVFQKT